MSQPDLICDICSNEYDLEDHIPRVIPKCGHTLCSLCILRILTASEWLQFQCPFDKQQLDSLILDEDAFPKNFKLMALLETQRNLQQIMKMPKESLTDQTKADETQKLDTEMGLMTLIPSSESNVQEEPKSEPQEIEILQKKIQKLRNVLDQRKIVNRKILGSLRKKKKEMTGLVDEVNIVYVKVDKLSMEFEEGLMETNKLKSEASAGQKRLALMNNNLVESYNESEKIKGEIKLKEEAVRELINRLRQAREEKKMLKEEGENLREDNLKLRKSLDVKETEKKTVKKELELKVRKLENETEKVVKEKEEVHWNAETLRILGVQGRVECERLQNQVESKVRELENLKTKLSLVTKERDEALSFYSKTPEYSQSRCQIF